MVPASLLPDHPGDTFDCRPLLEASGESFLQQVSKKENEEEDRDKYPNADCPEPVHESVEARDIVQHLKGCWGNGCLFDSLLRRDGRGKGQRSGICGKHVTAGSAHEHRRLARHLTLEEVKFKVAVTLKCDGRWVQRGPLLSGELSRERGRRSGLALGLNNQLVGDALVRRSERREARHWVRNACLSADEEWELSR
jgi:hypothetical protein